MNKLEELIYQAIGEASMCWDETPKGVFDSSNAERISEELLKNIQLYFNYGNFEDELTHLLNRYSKENGSNTPDFILAKYLEGCLKNFDHAVSYRENWYGREGTFAKAPLIVEQNK